MTPLPSFSTPSAKTGSFEVDTVNGKIVPVIYYYFGKPGGDAGLGNTPESVSANNNLQESEFLGNDEKSGAARGIRAPSSSSATRKSLPKSTS